MPESREIRKSRPVSSTERRPAITTEVLRARPVPGAIDHRGLTRRIIARFPKILAALAK
jgi:hypothetical protein